jgi:ornithine lipid ester-linked acyl 2-hydroxylase
MRVKNEMQQSAISWFANFARTIVETLFRIVSGDHTFYDTHDLSWIKEFEKNTPEIKKEFESLRQRNILIPNWEDISNDPSVKVGEDWKTFVLKVYSNKIAKNAAHCPVTSSLIDKYSFIHTAWFSVLEPGKSLPFHRGPYNGVLRYHLGLIIPEDASKCYIQVGNDIRHWKEGESLLFDDSHMHAAFNHSDDLRVVLFIDIERPLPFPLNLLNKSMIAIAKNSKYIKAIVKNANK